MTCALIEWDLTCFVSRVYYMGSGLLSKQVGSLLLLCLRNHIYKPATHIKGNNHSVFLFQTPVLHLHRYTFFQTFCFLPPNIVVCSLHWINMEGENNLFLNIWANADIFVEILAHLPPKEIYNIRSASKNLESFTKSLEFDAKHFFSCEEMFRNLIGFYQNFSINDPLLKPWRHYDFNQSITFHPIRGGYFYEPMFIPIQECAGGLPSLSYLIGTILLH